MAVRAVRHRETRVTGRMRVDEYGHVFGVSAFGALDGP